jgi:predicted HTH domain antitoxin
MAVAYHPFRDQAGEIPPTLQKRDRGQRTKDGAVMGNVRVELPEGVARLLHDSDLPVERAALELIVLELYRRRAVSSGKAARLLGMDRFDFIRHASDLGIPFLDMTKEEWEAEVERIKTL